MLKSGKILDLKDAFGGKGSQSKDPGKPRGCVFSGRIRYWVQGGQNEAGAWPICMARV